MASRIIDISHSFLSCSTMVLLLLLTSFFFLLQCLLPFCCWILLHGSRSTTSGPRSFPVIGCLLSFYENRRRLLDWYTELLSSSPSQTITVRRLGATTTIVTADPANVEHILKTNFANYPKGKPFTDILGDLLGNGIFNVDGEQWRSQRKLVSHEFTTRSLRRLVADTLEAEATFRLLPILDSAAAEHRAVDLQELLKRFAFDVICKVSLGLDPGCLTPSLPTSPLAAAFDAASAIIARRGALPLPVVWKMKKLMNIGSEKKLKLEVKHIHDLIDKLVQERKGEGLSGKNDFLSRLIAGENHDEGEIRDMVISFIMAGRDTTSSALTWFFWLLTQHRDVENELLDEILFLSTPAAGDLEGIRSMKLLEASLCESMRLYPPVAWDSKHAAAADVLPDGTEVRRGDRVTYFPYGMGRMARVWGEDCSEFKPRRWLTESGDADAFVSPFKFPVFQAGPRSCLGKEMAFVQMKCVASSVLRRYEVSPVDDRRPVFVPLLTAHMAGGLKVFVRRRG